MVSFSDRPGYGTWQKIGCFVLFLVLVFSNLTLLLAWSLSFWDPSTDTYRALTFLDFVLVPGALIISALILRVYWRIFLKD